MNNVNQNIPACWLFWLLNLLNEYATLIGAVATFFTVFVALYLGYWKEKWRKPKLNLFFREDKQYPNFHKLPFEAFDETINFDGQKLYIYRPGFNARVKVFNEGKSTARKVQARVEKIELYNGETKTKSERYYHPTTVKWSGEGDWSPIDIVPGSYFFLDVFFAKNETSNEIFSFNDKLLTDHNINLAKELLMEAIQKDIRPSGNIFWNVWIDMSYPRGVTEQYVFEGDIIIYFIVNAENCGPIKFKAIINWTFYNWNHPDIRIKQNNKYINNDEGEKPW